MNDHALWSQTQLMCANETMAKAGPGWRFWFLPTKLPTVWDLVTYQSIWSSRVRLLRTHHLSITGTALIGCHTGRGQEDAYKELDLLSGGTFPLEWTPGGTMPGLLYHGLQEERMLKTRLLMKPLRASSFNELWLIIFRLSLCHHFGLGFSDLVDDYIWLYVAFPFITCWFDLFYPII